jgi:hypothetical protein
MDEANDVRTSFVDSVPYQLRRIVPRPRHWRGEELPVKIWADQIAAPRALRLRLDEPAVGGVAQQPAATARMTPFPPG